MALFLLHALPSISNIQSGAKEMSAADIWVYWVVYLKRSNFFIFLSSAEVVETPATVLNFKILLRVEVNFEDG